MNTQWTIAFPVVLLIVLLVWFAIGPGWWGVAISAGVIAVAVFFTNQMSPVSKAGSGNVGQRSGPSQPEPGA
jgi:hypothetical protein